MEFTVNDALLVGENPPFHSPARRTFESVLRWLLRMDNQPALMLLQFYAYFQASGDGVTKGLFYKEPEAQFTTFAHVSSFSFSFWGLTVWLPQGGRVMSVGRPWG